MSGIEFTAEDWRRIKQAGRLLGGLTGTLATLTAVSAGLLRRQAADARRIIPLAEAPPPRGDGLYGAKVGGKALTMVILGDSSAAGYGVHRPRETPGALLATAVSRRLSRPVRLYRLAVVGSMSSGLPYQVDAALEYGPDIAVILIGGNDVTHASARATALAGPQVESRPGRRTDGRRGPGRWPHGVAGQPAGPDVRGRSGADVQFRPVPPVR